MIKQIFEQKLYKNIGENKKMSGSEIDSLPNLKHIEKLGEINNKEVTDFEQSFLEWCYAPVPALLEKFGQKFGEIDNPLIKDYEDSFISYFY